MNISSGPSYLVYPYSLIFCFDNNMNVEYQYFYIDYFWSKWIIQGLLESPMPNLGYILNISFMI